MTRQARPPHPTSSHLAQPLPSLSLSILGKPLQSILVCLDVSKLHHQYAKRKAGPNVHSLVFCLTMHHLTLPQMVSAHCMFLPREHISPALQCPVVFLHSCNVWSTYGVDWSPKCYDLFHSHTLANERGRSLGSEKDGQRRLTGD